MSRELLLDREWIVTNGLGGYASGTISGAITRRYHGLLIAALPAPLGRMVMWSHVSEFLRFSDNDVVSLGAEERAGGQLDLQSADFLCEFRLEDGLPVWIYRVREVVVEKRVLLPHLQNTVHVSYQVIAGKAPPQLELRPAFHFRHHEASVDAGLAAPYKLTAVDDRYEIAAARRKLPPLRMRICGRGSTFTIAPAKIHQVVYRTEQQRGYAHEGQLWSPGFFRVDLREQSTATLIGSTEPWDIIDVLSPAGRFEEAARAHAAGDEVRTIIAGYHWFTDWGRDTMIGLEGLTLTTGRCLEAGYILRTFAHYVWDGLIPNMFPDEEKEGRYNTADATLWFFHAFNRYFEQTDDRITLKLLLPILIDIIEHHLRGTKFNIHVDPNDGLLAQGENGYALTWMDAKMEDWVVTPRRGKAVEINALWYNALRLLAAWLRQTGEAASLQSYEEQAERARSSFNERFWYAKGGYLYDVVDCDGQNGTDDISCRPNQLFAISLDHPVLDQERWESVLDVVEKRLVTPVGLLRPMIPNTRQFIRATSARATVLITRARSGHG